MNIYDIIEKKKNRLTLTEEEITYFVDNYTEGSIEDYQAAALLMAICINDLNFDETFFLTKAMLNSGDLIDLSKIKKTKVDKHSTGGVGDTTTLIIGPILACFDLAFAKLSGRGLGHTGGTLDKLESIKGLDVQLDVEHFIKNTNDINISISGQTENIAPADKKIYALRDVTATVDNIALIASSIMSKKLSIDTDYLLLDVKVGSGAFMKDLESAKKLAETMVKIGNRFGRKTLATITNMDQPLADYIGNSLEVIEAIKTLNNNGPKNLTDLSVYLSAKILVMAGKFEDLEEANKAVRQKLENKEALNKFKEFVEKQNGDVSYVDNLDKFKLSDYKVDIKSGNSGYVKRLDALLIGEAAKELGAGRESKDDKIDLGAGIILNKKVGDFVEKDEVLASIYTNKKDKVDEAISLIKKAYELGDKNKESYKLVLGEIE
jgi:pyrimidine-nucleoside phosphorylase